MYTVLAPLEIPIARAMMIIPVNDDVNNITVSKKKISIKVLLTHKEKIATKTTKTICVLGPLYVLHNERGTEHAKAYSNLMYQFTIVINIRSIPSQVDEPYKHPDGLH